MKASIVIPLFFLGCVTAGYLQGSVIINRHKREMHGPLLDACCGASLIENAKQFHEESKECVDEILGTPKAPDFSKPPTEDEIKEMHQKHMCITECTTKKMNLLNDDGTLNPEKVIAYSKETSKGTFLENEIEAITKQCLDEAEAKAEKGGKCNEVPHHLWKCVAYQSMVKCPADLIKDKPRCDAVLDDIKNGRVPPFRPPPPPKE